MNPYEPKNRIGKVKVDFHPICFEHEDWIDALLRVRKPKPAEEKAGMRPEEVRALLVKMVNEEIFPRVNEKLRRLAVATKKLSAEVERIREKDAARNAADQKSRAAIGAAMRNLIETQDQTRSDAMNDELTEAEVEERIEYEEDEPRERKPKRDWSERWFWPVLIFTAVLVVGSTVHSVLQLKAWLHEWATPKPPAAYQHRPRRRDTTKPRIVIPDPTPPRHLLDGDAMRLM